MQGGRGRGRGRGVGGPGINPIFDLGDPFSGFGGPANLMSGLFGGANPFSDPFFSSSPFGSGNLFTEPFFARPMISESMFGGSGFFGPMGSPFMNAVPSGFIGHQEAPERRPSQSRGPIIEEIDSEEEEEDKDDGGEIREKPKKHRRLSNGPHVEEPEDKIVGRQLQQRNNYSEMNHQRHLQSQPQSRSFTFQSSSMVSYGGPNGAYYTASNTRRTGSDGVTYEETKEADTLTRQATHKVSKGLHNKGHSYTRKLNSDGKVDTMQTLHNLNEDELPVFEEAWNGSAQKHLPGWAGRENAEGGGRGGLALPSTEASHRNGRSRVSEARHRNNGVPRGRARD